MAFNIWNPADLDFISIVLISYILGIVHGITPDEHTWPITFSYSVGSYSTKGGMKTGLIFSSGFTIQRAFLSELSFLALAGIFMTAMVFGITYILVGIAMAAVGIYLARKGKIFHIHIIEKYLGRITGMHKSHGQEEEELSHKTNPILHDNIKPIPLKLAFVHGLIAGFGFGAFALIIYTVLAPSMPSIYLGFIPGLLFGLGTMTMQILFGAGFGKYLSGNKQLSKEGIAYVGKNISRLVLTYGGLAFVLSGIAILIFPEILNYNFITPVKVHNLHALGIGFFLVIISVVCVGIIGYKISMRNAERLGYTNSKEAKQN